MPAGRRSRRRIVYPEPMEHVERVHALNGRLAPQLHLRRILVSSAESLDAGEDGL